MMDESTTGRTRRWVVSVALVASGVLAGGMLAGSQLAHAADTSGTGATTPVGGAPAAMTHGPGETLLTGATADGVTTAAEKAAPNATVIRVETDSGGAAYEAHMQRADGTYVTVTFDKDLNVLDTEDGFGPGPAGQAPGAAAPGATA